MDHFNEIGYTGVLNRLTEYCIVAAAFIVLLVIIIVCCCCCCRARRRKKYAAAAVTTATGSYDANMNWVPAKQPRKGSPAAKGKGQKADPKTHKPKPKGKK
jgi:hypothetical protein